MASKPPKKTARNKGPVNPAAVCAKPTMRNADYMTLPTTLGQLKASGYADRTVKEELRVNLLARLRSGDRVFPDIVGYEDSVTPTLERALLAGHDVIMLGERGQAKSKLMRYLVDLLDETVPIVEGSELNDHPYHPVSAMARKLVDDLGDEAPVAWVGRDERYSEKLATPDTAVADLIGDVDPIRVAEGRYLGDEMTIHFGLVPRTNRGIVAINELPDLPERIQVSLLNILEERDIQIRGYKIRLPLDIMLVASANPEDYTHRGRIITPLKDRFAAQVRTHYPYRIDDEIAIMDQEAMLARADDVELRIPQHLKEVVAEFSAQLRSSSQVNQRSGVSVRFSIGSLETLAASAMRRAVLRGEPLAVPRAVDFYAVIPAAIGRIEFDMLEEGREVQVLERALRRALLEVWHHRLGGEDTSALTTAFDEGLIAETSEEMSSGDFVGQFEGAAEAGLFIERLVGRLDLNDSVAERASALEFALEGLHLTKQLNKELTESPGRWRFQSDL
jgi:magnesium chelatase subunit I